MASCKSTSAGILGEAWIINFEDWLSATKTITSGVLSAITMAAGKNAYRLTSHDKAFEASYSMNKGSYINSLVHQVILRAFDRTQNVKDTVSKLAYGRYVVIVKNVDNGVDQTKFEVYGADNGLTASAIEFNSTDGDGIVSAVTLASEDTARESALPLSVFSTSLAATESMIRGLEPTTTVNNG